MLSSRSVTSTVKAAVWEKGRPALDSTVILPNMKDSAFVASKNQNQPPQYIVDLNTRTTYLKGKFLDKGGFARVHELTDLTTNIVYAGKIIPKNRITKPHYREKIVREIELHQTLKHANVVGFHHFFEDEENVYIILENCAHKSLVHVVRHRRSLTEPEVRYYMKQLIAGVQYIHNQNVIHRDLKLGNMFLSENLIVKIGDFGLATRVEQTGSKKTTICGTPNYIAPEVLSKQGHTPAADVWAIGCIMYAMLVGQPPFESGSLKATYSRIANNNYTIPPLVSSDARSLITKLLHPDPNQRLDLSSVLQHPFFTRGFTPQTLPSSSCVVPPKFPNTAKSCSSATTSPDSLSHQNNLAVELRKLTRTVSQLCLSGSRNDIKFNNTKDKLQSKSKKENSIQNTFRQKLNHVLGTGKKPKPLTAAGLYHHLSIALNTMSQPVDVSINQSIITNASVVFISKWIDYSNKYGFGFQLSDQNIGVLFNDGSKIGFSSDRTRIEFHDCEGKMTAHSVGAIPVSLLDHYTLLKYFAKYMDENLTEGGTYKSSESKKNDLIPVMQRWIRTTKAIIMQLSSGTIQVNFFKDHTKVILSDDKQDVLITFIDENRESNTFQLSKLVQNGCPSHLYQRLLYVLSMLTDFAQLESTDV